MEYSLMLYDIHKGLLKTNKKTFTTVEQAQGHASLYGFQIHDWKIEEMEV